ncbi:replication protein A 14 kDa subunit-like [Prorops nasuta]|uniref:replication protein A 14 kDa subunit-like n=1 Tax=Prorops nasuta TaxID=863751 RepID=UPI0034CD2048
MATLDPLLRISGNQLGQHVGDEVVLIGTVTRKTTNGMNIELCTTDNTQVNVTLPEPITDNVEGYIEVYGTAQSKSTLSCKRYVVFPPHMTEYFNIKEYNELLMALKVAGLTALSNSHLKK